MAQNNLAREIFQQPKTTTFAPEQPAVKSEPKVKERLKVSTFEKVLGATLAIVASVLMIYVVSSKIALSNSQHELQQLDNQVATMHNKNTNYKQQIGELQSSSRLEKIAKSSGMSLSNSNIRNVTK
ncbi:cell division protein FtsL [Lentilactobacillus curieae]|uniref:Cell division protein FtsL n=1 Tax=Lentilactobacillus curieae TaxID=1138822 RepID=A0A1S6QG53_9LACO|nr:cell division protein FtsL [Lentilactobacillus curieae]AQW20581.1 cell division protein FtsL [Lentilactobacillus curieae]